MSICLFSQKQKKRRVSVFVRLSSRAVPTHHLFVKHITAPPIECDVIECERTKERARGGETDGEEKGDVLCPSGLWENKKNTKKTKNKAEFLSVCVCVCGGGRKACVMRRDRRWVCGCLRTAFVA